MKSIPFEDRTNETPEQAATRQLRAVAGLVTQAAAGLCEGNPALTTQLIAIALGQVLAQTDARIGDVLALVRQEREVAQAMLEEQALLRRPPADA